MYDEFRYSKDRPYFHSFPGHVSCYLVFIIVTFFLLLLFLSPLRSSWLASILLTKMKPRSSVLQLRARLLMPVELVSLKNPLSLLPTLPPLSLPTLPPSLSLSLLPTLPPPLSLSAMKRKPPPENKKPVATAPPVSNNRDPYSLGGDSAEKGKPNKPKGKKLTKADIGVPTEFR